MTYKEMCEGCESKKCKSVGCARVREGKREDFRDVKGEDFSCVGKDFPTPFELLSDAVILRRKIYAKTIA